MEVALALAALVIGGALAWIAATRAAAARLDATEAARREAELALERASAELDAERRAAGERAALLEQSRKQVEDAVGNLARQALHANSELFLRQAQEQFAALDQRTRGALEQKKSELEGLLKPLAENLGKLDAAARAMEEKRAAAYGALEAQITQLSQATQALDQSSRALSTTLQGSSQARGRWGEVALKNVVELAGMTEHCDFDLQSVVGDLRPDLVVRLPGEGRIPVDAKVPLAAFLRASEAGLAPEALAALRAEHAAALRSHVLDLAQRDYASALGGRVDVTVLFVPADPILAAAFEEMPELQTEAMRRRVLIATPVTLVALLRTIALYWRQDSVEKNAADTAAVARELYERIALFAEHLGTVGKGLERALAGYNAAVSSFEARVLPVGQKLDRLQLSEPSKRALAAPPPLDEAPRGLAKGAGGGA